MRRMVVFLIALLAAWLGVFEPAGASPRTAAIALIHTYDAHHDSTAMTVSGADRGPPVVSVPVTTGGVVQSEPGVSASVSFLASAARGTTYDMVARSADFATGAPPARAGAGPARGPASDLRCLRVAARAGDDIVRALSATERRTLDDALRPDKLDHIFDPKHNFDPLVQQFGSREAAMEQIVRSIGGPLPQAGRFEIAQSIGGQTVIIRGAVVDGIPRIGTAFTP